MLDPKHDGKMAKYKAAGRPRFDKELQKRRNVNMSDPIAEKAKRIGAGNISRGIRKAVEVFDE